jgi:hypothetical protein
MLHTITYIDLVTAMEAVTPGPVGVRSPRRRLLMLPSGISRWIMLVVDAGGGPVEAEAIPAV